MTFARKFQFIYSAISEHSSEPRPMSLALACSAWLVIVDYICREISRRDDFKNLKIVTAG
jgi:hypothetical protein